MEQDERNNSLSLEKKIDEIYKAVDKLRKYFILTFWVTIVAFVLPLILLIIFIPMFLKSYLSAFDGLL